MVVIDATEFGDVLSLSNASYQIGVEAPNEDSPNSIEKCGQAFTIPFYIVVNSQPVSPFNYTTTDTFSLENYNVGQIWSYRRSLAKSGVYHQAKIGEISNQNWGGGNDYIYKYLFLNKSETNNQLNDWKGGIDVSVLKAGEDRAYGWYKYYTQQNLQNISSLMSFGLKNISGTNTGLAMVPYIRDTRRSIGINNFILKKTDILSSNTQISNCSIKFNDRIGIGDYFYADIHGLQGCSWPSYVSNNKISPYYIPFRALTNRDVDNLLVVGKTMAQTFMANAATRLHPVEWVSGIAGGIAATMMSKENLTSTQLYNTWITTLQEIVSKTSPIGWKICGD